MLSLQSNRRKLQKNNACKRYFLKVRKFYGKLEDIFYKENEKWQDL